MDKDRQPHVIEIEAPAMAYFEIPLDWSQDFNAEFKLNNQLVRERMKQRIVFQNFWIEGDLSDDVSDRLDAMVLEVRHALHKFGDGTILWWRQRPHVTRDEGRSIGRLRVGTSPSLSALFWSDLAQKYGSRTSPHG